MTNPRQALATIRGLRKSFPGENKPALSDVDLDVLPGLVTGLVGPDGAGKTTLLRLLAGLLVPTRGELSVLGLNPTHDSDALRDSIGYMPQKFGLYEDLSVMENLALYADLKGLVGERRRTTFDRLLAFTDLARFTDRLAGRLSGGMKQKLGLACTLLGTPKVLLLDEPGVGVDPVSRRELWRMVHELIAGGIAVVWSTAYLDEAEACDHVVLLNEGEILFAGAPAELHDRVRNRVFLLSDLEERPRIALKNARRDPASMDGVVQGRGVRLIARPDAELHPQDFGVSSAATLRPTRPRFEDGFIDLLGGVPSAESELANAISEHPHDDAIVIRTQQLTKKYGDFKAADEISVSVKRGEVFGLLGPNGAGKSTTFKMLCGLVSPTSGDAQVAGVNLRSSRSEARQRLGYMAQKFSLYGNLSVRQNMEFFGGAYALAGKRLKSAIERMVHVFELAPLMRRAAGDLPLGHKQRLALACALLHGPEILFLDEPTSGVDPLTRREFWTHINGVVERGVTVLVTTHFMDEAEYCDRIGLISRGKMIATGTPDDLKAKATTPEQPDPTMEEAFIALVTEAA
ncbi:MAG: ABC transporter ATP-binding protein [Myxococcales bacterium]|nr:ABC transporter ATP-binding protein [Myxococcales bacterium]